MKFFFIYFIISSLLIAKQSNDIIVLSRKVGSTIDAAENSILKLFPDVVGFESAQIYELSPNRYMVKIVYVKNTKYILKKRYLTWLQLERLKYKVNSVAQISDKQKELEYDYMNYLRVYSILDEIPKNSFCSVKIKNGNKINGTYVDYKDDFLNIQSFRSKLSFNIEDIVFIDFRLISDDNAIFKRQLSYIIGISIGLFASEIWNNQKSPQEDMVWHNRFASIALGLFFSREVYEAIIYLTSPKEKIIFSPEELVKTK